ncbi:hypothetical protein CYLTODRAFT_423823 [Cylindrobasidium torrendii FP15055 ss-10]|uniref:Uncharacterized protein n=1 Tax=Cylindrobasidium torrendii FP15055 ss-10 TaxID=1314674 RepID=A0A0D7B6Z6_9AGAR|nr:hypothetical protein CYLTODRAFT_423823 [Cylindrobasidium torrendii FP15055 ss-10]
MFSFSPSSSFSFDELNHSSSADVLFGSPSKKSAYTSEKQKQAAPGLGYFVFNNAGSEPTHDTQRPSTQPSLPRSTERPAPTAPAAAADDHVAEEEARLRKRTEEQAAEAVRGEEAWVRMGGTLMDARGRRDVERTKFMREELKLRDHEEALAQQWGAYEDAWRRLAHFRDSSSLSFTDIPWPVHPPPRSVDDITAKKIEAFLTEPLTIRGTKTTRKERIRASLLRWHPDKMTKVVQRVAEGEDRSSVEKGIAVVTQSIHSMNR